MLWRRIVRNGPTLLTVGLMLSLVEVFVAPTPAAAAEIVHVPVAASGYRQEVAIDATVRCSTPDCSGTLYFRTSDPTGEDLPPLSSYTAQPMTVTSLSPATETYVVSFHGFIPSAVMDTRGVDYIFSILDGTETSWFPSVPDQLIEALPVPQHIYVIEPIHLTHTPTVVVSYVHEPIHVVARATCVTGTCSAELSFRSSAGLDTLEGTLSNVQDGFTGEGFSTVPMASRPVEELGPAVEVLEFSADIPAEVVDTNGVDYAIHATDAYASSHWPGTSYVGSQIPIDALGAWHHVEVFSRPLVAHVPSAYYVPGQALQVSAELTSATGFPTVTLLYRVSTHDGFVSLPMTVRETPVRRPEGSVYTATGGIPGSYTAQGGPMVYAIAVDDGYQTTYAPPTAGYINSNVGFIVLPQSAPV